MKKPFLRSWSAHAYRSAFVRSLLFVVGCIAAVSAPGALIHQWTFNDGTGNDWVGASPGYATNYPGAWNANGQLLLNGVNEYFRTVTLPETLTNKTMVVWVTLSNLSQLGGSAFTIEDPSTTDVFDSIQFGGAFGSGRWFNDSDSYRRSATNLVGNFPVETSTSEIMFAAVFGDGGPTNITLYRNGILYSNYSSTNSPATFTNGVADVTMGLRENNHAADTGGSATGNDAFLSGAVDETRIYDTALNAAAIGAIFTNGPVYGLPLPNGGPGYALSINPRNSQYISTVSIGVSNNYTLSAWI